MWGFSLLIKHFAADSCGPHSCPEYYECQSVNGFNFECVFQCEGRPCCESVPNPLCCVNDGMCSDENFVYNGTNADGCQCICNDNFAGSFSII